MLKGLALTPPTVGRISIGKVVEKNGKRLPEKDDEFTITSQVQSQGQWVNHPLDKELRKANEKLRSIPIKLLFDDPELNLRAQYSLFDRNTGRPMCVGNGETCKRMVNGKLESHDCPTPESCTVAVNNQCKPYGRMNVRIGDDDELGSFVFRTTGYNSIRTLSTRLSYFSAVSGGMLSTMPLELRIRSKSTAQSFRAAIYYVDLVVRDGLSLNDAIQQAKSEYDARQQAGFNQRALDDVARKGFTAGAFEESEDEGLSVVEEFYPESNASDTTTKTSETLADKLTDKAAQL